MAAEINLATIEVDEKKTAKLADRLQAEEKRRKRHSSGRRGGRNSRPSSPHWTSSSRTPTAVSRGAGSPPPKRSSPQGKGRSAVS